METPQRVKPTHPLLWTPHVGNSPSGDPSQTTQVKVTTEPYLSLNHCLINTKQYWVTLCTYAEIDHFTNDEHSVVFVNEEALKTLDLQSGDFVQLSLKSDDVLTPVTRTASIYRADCASGLVFLSPLLWFNICHAQGVNAAVFGEPRRLNLQKLPTNVSREMPGLPWADEIHITLVSTHYYPPNLNLTRALSAYFNKNRRLCLNDILAIPRDCMEGEEYTLNISAEAPVAYYKVTKLSSSSTQKLNGATVVVQNEHSKLLQSTGSICMRLPLTMEWFLSDNPPGPYWCSLPLAGFSDIHRRLLEVISPYLQPVVPALPATILLTGPDGVGKYSLIRSLAVHLGLQLLKVNCHDLCGDSAAATEARIRNLITKAQSCTPSILLIENFEALGREKDYLTYDVRVAASFAESIKRGRDKCEQALILIATTSSAKINTEMSEVFLHELVMLSPTEDQRKEIIRGLLDSSPVRGVDIESIAKRTAGMVLGDLVTLVAAAKFKAHRRITIENYGGDCCPGWVEEQCMLETNDMSLTEADIDGALHQLQTQHADALGAPKIPNVSWDDVGGLDDVKAEILDTIQLPLQHPELFAQDLRRSGVLLYGPPGAGKTLLAKAVATECSLNFLSVKGPELINMYVGQSEENIREVFSRARSAAPCVIFFDELDSLAPNRGRTGDSGGVMDRVVSQLLAELDGLHTRSDVFIIGATNRPDLLDPALTRPGRFDKMLYVGVPESKELQLKIIKALVRKFKLSADVDLEAVTKQCSLTLTGADLYALCADAMMASIRRQVRAKENGQSVSSVEAGVTMDDFNTALESLKPSVTDEEMSRYRTIRAKQKVR